MNDIYYGSYFCSPREKAKTKIKVPPGMKLINDSYDGIKPPCGYYHYSNPESQGAIICEVNWNGYYDPKTEGISSAYSDRMYSWDSKNYEETVKEFEVSGDQAWAYNIPRLSDERKIEFAKKMLKIETDVRAVRFIHYYNVSNGYSCPVIQVIYKKG